MPARIYFGKSLTELSSILAGLQKDLGNGGIQELQVSGIRTKSGGVNDSRRDILIYQVRLEGFRIVNGMTDSEPNKTALIPLWPDPRKEIITRVESIHGRSCHFPHSNQ